MTSESTSTENDDGTAGAPSGRGCLTGTLIAFGLAVVLTVVGFFWIVDQGPRLLRGTVESGIIDELDVRDEQEIKNLRQEFDKLQSAWDDGDIDTRGLISIAEDLEGLLYAIEFWPGIRDEIENYYELRLAAAPNDIEREAIEEVRDLRLLWLEKAFCYMIRGLYSVERLHDAVVKPFLEDPESSAPRVKAVSEDLLERVDRVVYGAELASARISNPSTGSAGGNSTGGDSTGRVPEDRASEGSASESSVSEGSDSERLAARDSGSTPEDAKRSEPDRASADGDGFVRFVDENKVKRRSDGFSGMEFSKFVGAAVEAHRKSKEEDE